MKTIVVTGASSGIGRALAVRAARAGYGVVAVGRNVKALVALAGQVTEEGGAILTDVCDISVPANAPGVIARTLAAFGRLDVLVNNAGAAAAGPLATQTDEQLQQQFGTHVLGPLALVREALPALRAAQGHVFMVGSGVARVPIGGMGAYPASKSALRSATATLRRELRPFEIAVTYVDPGAVDTAFMSRAGMPGAPGEVLVSPDTVARKILLAIATRPRVLNVAPLQAAAVALGELLPLVTEVLLERNPALTGVTSTIPAIDARPAPAEPLALARTLSLPHSMPEPPPTEPPEPEAAEAEPAEPEPALPEAAVVDEAPHAETRVQQYEPEPEPEPEPQPEAEATENPHVVALRAEEEDDDFPIGALPNEARDDESEADFSATSEFNAALEPLKRRMERSHFEPAFVRGLLVPEAVIDVSEVAMRWAGMPNKHERALTSEVFFALAEWGFLAPRADGRYRVVRAAD
jgi:short-subunit dehydrogenase